MRAKVIFTDGFNISPTIETTDELLRDRLERISKMENANTPALAATRMVAITVAGMLPVSIHNTPEGRSYGATVSHIQRPEFWPNMDGHHAGVFLVHVGPWDVEYWGGKGFPDSPEFTTAIPQKESLSAGVSED